MENKIYQEIMSINKAILSGEFSSFDCMTKNQQVDLMKTWTQEMWDNYHLRDTISENEVFDAVFKIIDGDDSY